MSVSRETTIWCDDDGCSPRWEQRSGNAADVRAEIAKNGWTRGPGGKDYCPACGIKREEERARP